MDLGQAVRLVRVDPRRQSPCLGDQVEDLAAADAVDTDEVVALPIVEAERRTLAPSRSQQRRVEAATAN